MTVTNVMELFGVSIRLWFHLFRYCCTNFDLLFCLMRNSYPINYLRDLNPRVADAGAVSPFIFIVEL